MGQYYVYLHCRPCGTPFYVGKGARNRARILNCRRNIFHQSIVKKYGRENIQVYVFPCGSEGEAFFQEILWIKQLREQGIELVNMTDGGEGATGFKASEDTKIKMSIAKLGRKQKPESIEKTRLAQKGIKRTPEQIEANRIAHLGKKHSPEVREKMVLSHKLRWEINKDSEKYIARNKKISDAFRGRPLSDETKNKISISLTGKKQSAETIAKRVSKVIGIKRKGHSENTIRMLSAANLGKTLSEETKRRMSEAHKFRWEIKKTAQLSQTYKDKS